MDKLEYKILIIGGGITGLQATKDLVERGYKVILIEREPYLGGKVAQLDETFPVNAVSESCSLCYPLCYLLPEISKLYLKNNLQIFTYSKIKNIKKIKSKYIVEINKKTRYVDENKCNGCEKCIKVCPVKDIPNEFNFNLSKRTAIYQPMPNSIAPQHLIDSKNCLYFKDGSCNECEKVCPYKAINFNLKDEIFEESVDAIIIATGFDQINPTSLPQYGIQYKNVLTSLQFERMNSINGPTHGRILRISDNKEPKSIAFIQCVGSRTNDKPDCVSYCSTVCCMYSSKEALNIRKKKLPNCECYIFNTEKRAYGKQYYDMFLEAEQKWGVHYINGRVVNIVENPKNNNLIIQFENIETGEFCKKEFELVVLAAALAKSREKEQIAELIKQKLNKDGLFDKESIENLEKENIYIAGFARYPMNIPDSITDASAVAAKISFKLKLPLNHYNPEEEEKITDIQKEIISKTQNPRIGIFYCDFNDKISEIIDYDIIKKYFSSQNEVYFQEIIKNANTFKSKNKIIQLIKNNNINRVIFTSGSPRYFEEYFGLIMEEANLNKSLMEIIDLRELNAYIHFNDKNGAIIKAIQQINMAITKLICHNPLFIKKQPILQSALIINSDVTGIIIAHYLSAQNIETYLVQNNNIIFEEFNEKFIHSSHLNKKELEDILKNYKNDKLIKILENYNVNRVEGNAGNFSVTLSKLNSEIKINVATIIIAGGAAQSNSINNLFGYGTNGNIMTQMEFESNFNKIKSNHKIKNLGILLCVNQKLNPNSKYYKELEEKYGTRIALTSNCSNICCSKAIQKALEFKAENQDLQIYIIYRDLQLTGGILENIYRESKKYIIYLRYNSLDNINIEIDQNTLNIKVAFHELNSNTPIQIDLDALVLATPIVISNNIRELAKISKIRLEKYGFLQEEHSKLLPLNSTREGIFICGNSQWPNSLDLEISQALGCSMKVINFLSKGYLETNIQPAIINKDKCIGCGTCIRYCPYNAITFEFITKEYVFGSYKIRKAEVNPLICQSCGICVSECPVNAIKIPNSNDGALLSQILAFSKGIIENSRAGGI